MTDQPAILITGASGGIGREAALKCAEKGARIGIHYHNNQEIAEQILAGLPGQGHSLFQADITDAEAAESLVRSL